MPFPPGVQTVTLTGHQTRADGNGVPLPLRIRPVPMRIVSTTHDVVVKGDEPVVVTPDADGEWSVALVATDAVGFDPTGWTYHVGSGHDSWHISLPAALGTVDLSDLIDAGADGGQYVLVPGPLGPAGPSAYQVAVSNGFLGTETEWLASLQTDAQAYTTAAVSTHTTATDPHGDRAWADNKFATALDLTTLNGTVNTIDGYLNDCLTRVAAIEQGSAFLAGAHFTAPVDIASGGLAALRFVGRRTASGPPATGTWAAGDTVQDAAGAWWLCTAAGTPGTWASPLTALLPLSGGTLTGTVTSNAAGATSTAFGGGVASDTFDRWRILANGTVETGPGNAARDTNWRRSAPNEWTTDDSVIVSLMLRHLGSTLGFYGAAATTKPTVSGAKGGNAALASLITALATLGLIADSTTA
ncbi:hypothetical protein [Streptomyces altiplanensis]